MPLFRGKIFHTTLALSLTVGTLQLFAEEETLNVILEQKEQKVAPKVYLSLQNAIAKTLKSQWNILKAQLEIEQSMGTWIQSAGPFDPVLTGAYKYDDQTKAFSSQYLTGESRSLVEKTSSLKAAKLFRPGTSASAQIQIQEQDLSPRYFGISRTTQTDYTFTIDQPILKRLIWNMDWMQEKANEYNFEASKMDFLFTISEQLEAMVSEYWNVVQAQKLLDIARDAESRYRDLVAYTRKMIAANQMAQTDMEQVLVQLSTSVIARLNQEEQYYKAIRALQIAMGVSDTNLFDVEIVLEYILDPLPNNPKQILDLPIMLGMIDESIDVLRKDIYALELQEKGYDKLISASKNSLLPELDLVAEVNIQDNNENQGHWKGMDLERGRTEWSLAVNFSYPISTSNARGEWMQYRSEKFQTQVTKDLTKQKALSDISVALYENWNLYRVLGEAKQSVLENQILVRDEIKMLGLGLSTIFQVIRFEQDLTAALQTEVESLTQYAQNLVNIRFQTGTIVLLNKDGNIRIGDVTRIPQQELSAQTRSDQIVVGPKLISRN